MNTPAHLRAADPDAIQTAAHLLQHGGLIAFPTETVYGLGADATDDRAVARIFAAKGRPSFNPLIVHLATADWVTRYAVWTAAAEQLAQAFWPGPLTLVLPRRADSPIALLVSAGLDSLALRVPAHPVAQALLQAADRPVAAPSANPSGAVSPTRAQHVLEGLGDKVDLILDGGACAVGLESAVVDCSGAQPVLLRHGGLTLEALQAVVPTLTVTDLSQPDAPRSPGQLTSHYAPNKPLRLNAMTVAADEGLLAFGPNVPTGTGQVLNLSPSGDLAEAAAHLFAYLRALDALPVRALAAMPIPERGLGRAMNDRLRRAACRP